MEGAARPVSGLSGAAVIAAATDPQPMQPTFDTSRLLLGPRTLPDIEDCLAMDAMNCILT
jgi:hypothetical protein